MALFTELNRRGRTIVLVTHDAEIARSARRILTMQDGRIVSDNSGDPEARGDGPAPRPAASNADPETATPEAAP